MAFRAITDGSRLLLAGATAFAILATVPAAGAAPRRPRANKKPSAKAPALPALVSLTLEPGDNTLSGPQASQRVILTGRYADGSERDLTRGAKFFSLDPKVIAVSPDGIVRSMADGAGRVQASLGAKRAIAKFTIKESAAKTPVSFADDINPILTKAGCNQGACHGAQYGKGGFKLSLTGYEPDLDYLAIVKDAEGRRITPTEPDASLLLQKAAMTVPHGGGPRFKVNSQPYSTIKRWLEQGAPGLAKQEPEVARIEVFPAERQLTLKGEQQLVIRAYLSDGRVEDVTHKAQLNALNDAVAEVDSDGLITMVGKGETAIMVRYRGQAAVSRVMLPYATIARYPAQPAHNFVDGLVANKWKKLGLLPSDLCTDHEFIRRLYLDVLGVLPAPEEVTRFLADREPTKRAKLIDDVLNRPEYVDFWTYKWADLLRVNRDKLGGEKGMWAFYYWIRAAFRDNKKADEFVKELLTAQGSTYTTGQANYFRVANNPADLAETTSQVFLGIRMQCAKCHHHPFEKWSQDDYYSMAAYFARVGSKNSSEFGLFGGETVVRVNSGGEVGHPKTGRRMEPKPLDAPPADDPVDRRRALAAWLTSKENMMFSRNIVNRYWGYLMGRGIVDPIDDMRVTNPPSNPELLDALAKDFSANGFDFKHLLRTILNSRTYQLSANATPENKMDNTFATHYTVKRLTAEQLLDAINFATGTQDKFQNIPLGTRAIQLPDTAYNNYFLDTFGRPTRIITCECERVVEPNMAQALHLMNGDLVNQKIADGQGRLSKAIAANKADTEIINELYLATYARQPTADETKSALKAIEEVLHPELVKPIEAPRGTSGVVRRDAKAPPAAEPSAPPTPAAAPLKTNEMTAARKEALEDLLWALLNSREFLFNH